MTSELFKPSIEMVTDIAEGLVLFVGDFGQSVAFKKMQSERFPLIFREAFQHFSQSRSTNYSLESFLILHRTRRSVNGGFYLPFYTGCRPIACC